MVAIVLLLQVRGRMTVAELGQHLEASERTIRRDLESLGAAGVPVYPQRGRGGGWQLLDGHRLDLTGLTREEAQALLLVAELGSASSASTLGPGVAQGFIAARRKLLAALPPPLRALAEQAATTVLVDASHWGGESCAPPQSAGSGAEYSHWERLRAAIIAGVQVDVRYEPPGRPAEDRRLHPHGLVCKRGVWYLMASAPAGLRTYRLSRVLSVTPTAEPASRPRGFDLAGAWAGVQRELSARMPLAIVVEVAVAPGALRRLRAMVGRWWPVQESGGVRDDGWALVTVEFASAAIAAAELAGFGHETEVVAPEAVRARLAALGRRFQDRYGDAAGTGQPAVSGTRTSSRAPG